MIIVKRRVVFGGKLMSLNFRELIHFAVLENVQRSGAKPSESLSTPCLMGTVLRDPLQTSRTSHQYSTEEFYGNLKLGELCASLEARKFNQSGPLVSTA